MDVQLNAAELALVERNLADYDPAGPAIAALQAQDGAVDAALEVVLAEAYGSSQMYAGRSLREVTLKVLREELCGQEGFRARVEAYVKQPEDAALLTAAIVYVLDVVTLPFAMSPAIATLVVLYVAKVGLNIFCEYTAPEEEVS